MIIDIETKKFQTRSDMPNTNWTKNNTYKVIDDNSYIAKKIIDFYPNFNFIFDNNNKIIDVEYVEPIPTIYEPTFEEKQIAINDAQTLTNSEQDEINIDLDYRVTMLELGV